ncbi:MAG: PD-(D/E)XK nuclease family transposase [Wujia sp.]
MKKTRMKSSSPERPVDRLRPIDDTFMQKLGEDREFCEEMLRIIMAKPALEVISNTTQKSIHNIDTRSVTIDIKCIDEAGTVYSVDVQKANDDDHQKRVRYNGSCLEIQLLEKGKMFKELPDVCMIFITETDFLGRGRVIYHVDRTIRETAEIISNGYSEIYVNAEVDDGSDLAEYMKIFKSETVCSNIKFPRICDLTDYYKNGKGRAEMCNVVEEYAKEYAEEYAKEYAEEGARESARKMIAHGDDVKYISEVTGLSIEVIEELRGK